MKHKFTFFLMLIFASANSYAQNEIWETQLNAHNITYLDRIYFLDENYGWTICGPYFFTTDGGENWYLDPNFWDNSGTDIVFINQDTGFIAGATGSILKTTNGGQSWIPIQTQATQNVIKLFFVDENNGWATLGQYSEGNILHTIDGGNSWVLKSVFYHCYDNISNIFFVNENTGWVAGCAYNTGNNYVAIKKTINGGESWETLDSLNNLSNFYMGIYFSDFSNGWIVGSYYNRYLIRHTQDGGLTWTEQTLPNNSSGTPTQANCVYFADDTTGWIGTSGPGGGAIYFTNDGGQNWQVQQLFSQAVFDIQMLNRDTGWAVGSGFVYHTTNGSLITNVIENQATEKQFKITPNPVTNTFHIETNSAISCENCQLEITNITGNSILRLSSISFEAITSKSIDLSNYPAGIYFVTIRYESNHQIKCFNQKIIRL
jgi:photosystem II stability/assembly factor-like uncharacterized protein